MNVQCSHHPLSIKKRIEITKLRTIIPDLVMTYVGPTMHVSPTSTSTSIIWQHIACSQICSLLGLGRIISYSSDWDQKKRDSTLHPLYANPATSIATVQSISTDRHVSGQSDASKQQMSRHGTSLLLLSLMIWRSPLGSYPERSRIGGWRVEGVR